MQEYASNIILNSVPVGPFKNPAGDILTSQIVGASVLAIVTDANGLEQDVSGITINPNTVGMDYWALGISINVEGNAKLGIAPLTDAEASGFAAHHEDMIIRVQRVVDALEHGTASLEVEQGAVYFDNSSGISGTAYPNGNPEAPLALLDDIVVVSNNRKIGRIFCTFKGGQGESFNNGVGHRHFIGTDASNFNNEWGLNLNGKGMSNNIFENLFVKGTTTGGTNKFIRCLVEAYVASDGSQNSTFEDCIIAASLQSKNQVHVKNSTFGAEGSTGSLNAGSVFFLGYINNCQGDMTIINLTESSSIVEVNGFRGKITIAASCNNGTINLRGCRGEIVNSTGGTTVNIFDEPLADTVWNEILTGATHNIATSAGRRLRELEDVSFIDSGTAQAGTASTIKLKAGSSAVDGFYEHVMIVITKNTGVGQTRSVESYVGSTKVATIHRPWKTTPDGTSEYAIVAFTSVHVEDVEDSAISNSALSEPLDSNLKKVNSVTVVQDGAGRVSTNVEKVAGASVSDINDFKADVSALATEANATTNANAILSALAGLNDLDAAEVVAAVWGGTAQSYIAAGTFGEKFALITSAVGGKFKVENVSGDGNALRLFLYDYNGTLLKSFDLKNPSGAVISTLLNSGAIVERVEYSP